MSRFGVIVSMNPLVVGLFCVAFGENKEQRISVSSGESRKGMKKHTVL
jgi:hypothetical protein